MREDLFSFIFGIRFVKARIKHIWISAEIYERIKQRRIVYAVIRFVNDISPIVLRQSIFPSQKIYESGSLISAGTEAYKTYLFGVYAKLSAIAFQPADCALHIGKRDGHSVGIIAIAENKGVYHDLVQPFRR